MKRVLIVMAFGAVLAAVVHADTFPAGTRVQFDRVEASKPELGRWDQGVILRMDPYGRYVIRGDGGATYTIQNDPRWIRPAGAPVTGPKWDGSPSNSGAAAPPAQAGGRQTAPGGNAPGGTPPANNVGAPGATNRQWAPGTRVQFDRAEGSKPEYGRWDTGVVAGKDGFGRIQIRGDNGITYNIHDDPRWILPEGAPLPGPKHDAFEVRVPRPGEANQAPPTTPTNGKGLTLGHYICSSFSEQILGLAFTLTGPRSYTFDAGGSGTLSVDVATGQASFTGPLGEVMRDDQLTALVKTGGGRSEVAFLGRSGTQVLSCHHE